MRRRAVVLSILSSTAVLVAGYQLGSQAQDAATVSTASTAAAAPSSSTPDATSTPVPAAAAAAASPSGASGTFTGASESTRFGTVQVQITVDNGTITDVTALQLTDKDQRSVSISNRAAPVLRQEVIAAQSANVQGVSGATYTSDGYLSSLQSALDQAGL